MVDVSDVQRYFLSFMASPLTFNTDCSNIQSVVNDIEKDLEENDSDK